MVAKVATAYLKWSPPQQTHMPQSHSPSSSPPQTLVSAIMSSPSSSSSSVGAFLIRRHQRRFSSLLFGTIAPKLYRSQSCPYPKSKLHIIPRACSGDCFEDISSSPSFSDEEFSMKIEGLTHRFQISDHAETGADPEETDRTKVVSSLRFEINPQQQPLSQNNEVEDEQLEEEWGELIAASIERKANSVDLPFSLRILKRKLRWGQEASESAYCSIKKAFLSMVFMIRELHSYTLQMRQLLYLEDLQGILERVQKEMQDSFVWLFQQVFSHTPTLMVYVMILLANFTVHSMSSNVAIAAESSPPGSPSLPLSITTEKTVAITAVERNEVAIQKFDSATKKSFPPVIGSNNNGCGGGKTASVGGNNGGGKTRPAVSGTEDEGWFDESNSKVSSLNHEQGSVAATTASSSLKGQLEIREMEEMRLWDEIVDEAERMQASARDESLDAETVTNFVSPVTVSIEGENDGGGDDINDDYRNHHDEYLRTELVYLRGLGQEPNNPLLLANFAQFLYLIARDYDRAEEYYKRAIKVEPKDAEAYNKYANFLWTARNDLWAAEETFLEAIDIDPSNSFYAANYAHFLWNTGGEDTCFPLDGPDDEDDDAAFQV